MSELKATRERLYELMRRAGDVAFWLRPERWTVYRALEQAASNERNPRNLSLLLDQMEAILVELEAL